MLILEKLELTWKRPCYMEKVLLPELVASHLVTCNQHTKQMGFFKDFRWKCFVIIPAASLKSMTVLTQHESVKADNIKAERTKLTCSECTPVQVEDVLKNLYNSNRNLIWSGFNAPLSFHQLFSIQTHCCMCSSMPHSISLSQSLQPLYFLLLYAFKKFMWGFSLPGALFDCQSFLQLSQWTFINTFKNQPDEENLWVFNCTWWRNW